MLNYKNTIVKKIDFDIWIKLKLKYDLKDNEKNQLLTIEDTNIKIIDEVYNSLDKGVIYKKIESMKQLDWIKKIEEK